MKKIAVFMLFGQSNATGHAVPMEKEDIIDTPLKNVFGLNRNPNQSFDNTELIFSGYTSAGMNLAETQDNTYSVSNCLAKRWQSAIDAGEKLPDLYILHISIGSQGLFGMWSPHRVDRTIIPGVLGVCKMSMYPFALHVIKLMNKYFQDNALSPDYLGIHWRGGSQEVRESIDRLRRELYGDYVTLFEGIRNAVGFDAPIVIHKLPFVSFMNKNDPSGAFLENMNYINGIFDTLSKDLPCVSVFDSRNYPKYDESVENYNMLRGDLIHYLGETNDWVASEILKKYKEERNA